MKPRPVLRYHGGKWLLAPWIISHFPPHDIYVEPFGGAASVLMRKKRSRVEVYNDLWATVVNVFRVLRDPATANELAWLLYLTPFARDEYNLTSAEEIKGVTNVEAARRTSHLVGIHRVPAPRVSGAKRVWRIQVEQGVRTIVLSYDIDGRPVTSFVCWLRISFYQRSALHRLSRRIRR